MKPQRGFKAFDKAMEGRGRKMASCKSCFYFAPDETGEEDCRNTNVTSFDFVKEPDGREYCIYWGVKERDNGR